MSPFNRGSGHHEQQAFFEDLDSGRFIDEFLNPPNGHFGKVGMRVIRRTEGEYFTPTRECFGGMKQAALTVSAVALFDQSPECDAGPKCLGRVIENRGRKSGSTGR